MNKLYKLTDSCGKTLDDTLWGPGVSHSGTGEGELCGPGWIHAYEHPLIAVLLNPIHANYDSPRLWEAAGVVGLRDGQIKCGCKTLTTVREIPLPKITMEMRVRFAILCAKEVCASSLAWNAWADKWLSGEDRTQAAAQAAEEAARMAARMAEEAARRRRGWRRRMAAVWAAVWAAETRAAKAAVWAAAKAAVWAAETRAAKAAVWAVWAAKAAVWAAEARAGTDIFAIAEKACSGLT